MNKPIARVMRVLFTGGGGGGLGSSHSHIQPFPNLVLHNPICIGDLDTDMWWEHLRESLGKEDLHKLGDLLVPAWNCMKVDDVLASAWIMSLEEGLLVCHFLELATKARTYPKRFVAVVTTHNALMVWLQHCVDYVGRRICGGRHPILLALLPFIRSKGCKPKSFGLSWCHTLHGS